MSNGIGFWALEKPQLEIAKVITWRSSDKEFTFYNKTTEKKESLPLPIRFIWLDQKYKITWFDSANECWIYSNEVPNLKQPLTVKSYKGWDIAEWLYSEIKEKSKAAWWKFTIALLASMNWELVKFEFNWSANEAFIEFWKSFNWYNILKYPIVVKKTTEGKTAWNKYNKPLFEQDTTEMDVKEYDDAMTYKWVVDDYAKSLKEFYAEANPVSEKMEETLDIDAKLKETAPKQLAEDKKPEIWELPF